MDGEAVLSVPPAPGGPGGGRRGAELEDERESLLERELSDVYLLLDHLSGRSDKCISDLKLDDPSGSGRQLDMVEEVCKMRWPLPEEPVAHARQATLLFKARDKLNQIASPANGATIAYTIMVLGNSGGVVSWLGRRLGLKRAHHDPKSRTDLARSAYPALFDSANSFRRWITTLQCMLLGGLLLTSLLSWNVASGKLILQRVDHLEATAIEIGRTLDAGEAATTGSLAPDDLAPTGTTSANLPAYDRVCRHAAPSDKPRTAAQSQVDTRHEQTCATARLVIQRRAMADRDLDEWASYWSWLKGLAARFNGVEPATYTGTGAFWPDVHPDMARGASLEQWSADLIIVLGNFVLPMLYGFLGATTAVVLDIQNKLRQSRLAPREKRMSQVQLVLGIIVGACIGLFMSPSSPDGGSSAAGAGGAVTAGSSVALSASALSFLAGFGVESVFKMLQSILQTMFGGQPSTAVTHIVQTQPPAPGAPPPAR